MGRRVLFLTHTCPLPQVSGERIRNLNLMRQLADREWRVSLFALAWGLLPGDQDRRSLAGMCEHVVLAPFTSSGLRRSVRILRAVALREPFNRVYFWDRAAADRLAALLANERFDVLVASHLYMVPYVPAPLRGSLVFDSVNVEARRLKAMAGAGRRRATFARLQQAPVRKWEAEVARTSARVLAVSWEERAYFENLARGRTVLVPNGVDTQRLHPRAEPAPPSRELLLMGSLEYSANLDALQYFLREILGRVTHADARVNVVGSGWPRALVRAAGQAPRRVDAAGFVADTRPYVERSRALLVPLRYGGGTRLKILEALAQGLPVVSTSMGCEGLRLEHEHDVLIADDPAAFARCIDRILEDDELCRRLCANGRETVERHFDWSRIGATLDAVLGEVVAEAGGGGW
jgi:glycosyltransferase involved in cell wall biosynthesis